MKKIIFSFLLFIILFYKINATCSYEEKIDLNTISSNVIYDYEYQEESKYFNLIIYNIVDEIKIKYRGKDYKASNYQSIIKGLQEGTILEINIYSSSSTNCSNEYLRKIYITIPYVNAYYNHSLCKDYMEYTVCNSKYLSYRNTYKIFIDSLNKIKNNEGTKSSETNLDEHDDIIFKETIDFIKENWIKLVLVIISFFISYSIWSLIYRKKKYKL